MTSRIKQPIALTIAGSDSGGGAGIQTDLKTFASLAVHGTSAITCLTAQNPKGVRGIQAATPEMVRQQIEAILEELPPKAAKTGMLYTTEIIQTVVSVWRGKKRPPLIVDPVMLATSGARLLKPEAIAVIQNDLLPLATLVTPNLDEAALLLGQPIDSEEGLRQAAHALYKKYGCAALVKGGHLRGGRDAVDVFYDGREELLLSAPFVRGVSTHGTGCTYSAAIVGYLALGCDLSYAVQLAKEYITQAIAQSTRAGKYSVLNCFWE